MQHLVQLFIILISVLMSNLCEGKPNRDVVARQNVQPMLGKHFGKPVFIRIIKEEYLLELWLKETNGEWRILKTYDIAAMSGDLGPKTAEGDEQAPEGFYRVYKSNMNPRSRYHLAFNIGYPNSYDRKLGRTGSFIMIHGDMVSIGCFAMTDARIEEIYTLVDEAFKAGAGYIPVQVYPFRMTPERMQEEEESEHIDFWNHLLPGWQYTESKKAPYPDKDNQ